jgi:hypothetical protein
MTEENKAVGAELLFECAVCNKVYNKSGMCSECQAVLKPKGG